MTSEPINKKKVFWLKAYIYNNLNNDKMSNLKKVMSLQLGICFVTIK
jgi:hypothetical protein